MTILSRFGKWISDLFEKHRLVRRSLVVFATSMVGWTTYVLYTNLELISAEIVSLHGITVGILSTAVARYFYERHNSQPLDKEIPFQFDTPKEKNDE